MATRIVHFSDIHLFVPGAKWKLRDFVSKRVPGWVNQRVLPRGRAFREARTVLPILLRDALAERPDLLVFSGDASCLGTEEEFALAAELLRVTDPTHPPALAVPGNHDYYHAGDVAAGLFERYFAPWQQGDRIDAHVYPFGRRVGPLYFVAVNSCRPSPWSWDATGVVGGQQLERLRLLLDRPEARSAIKVLVTHYPIALANGKPEYRGRRLRDLHDLLHVAQSFGVVLWLHGHRHNTYYVPATTHRPIASLCVGSGTQRHVWTYAVYHITDQGQFLIDQRCFVPDQGRFVTTKRFEVPLPNVSTVSVGIETIPMTA